MEHDRCGVCGMSPLIPVLKGELRLVAESAPMQRTLKRAARFAASDAPIVIVGETGTGKELVARMVHANSTRSARPFVAVNMAALPFELLESELFGHGKGAFTGAASARVGLFEAADGGTLFLDEIGEMPLGLQVKVLRALQGGEVRRVGENQPFAVDVRVICATHQELLQQVRAGLFREDLYYRLKVLTLVVPPLRERQADILPLARHFLAGERTKASHFSIAAQERLVAHRWPGNVRELQNVVKHGAALATTAEVGPDDLPEPLDGRGVAMLAGDDAPASLGTLAEVERTHILRVLEACGGSQSEAARILGVARNTLWRKLSAWGDSAS